jgi:hypothetical protein
LISLVGLSHAELEKITYDSQLAIPFCSTRDIPLRHNGLFNDLSASQPPEEKHGPRACIQDVNGTDKHCAYTKPTFAGNRGISIVAMTDVADRIFQMPAFHDQRIHQHRSTDPPYAVKQLPGRGTGVVAIRTLNRGDRIFMEPPALVVHSKVYDFMDSDFIHLQDAAVEGLPNNTRSMFMDLWGEWGGNKVDDIMNTNSFALQLLDKKETFSMVVPEIAVSRHLGHNQFSHLSA